MGKLLLALSVIVVVFQGCTQKRNIESGTADEPDTLRESSASIPVNPEPAHFPADSSLFINPIIPFEETREFYVSLYFLDTVEDEDPYKYLSSRTDALIYEGEHGERRSRLPLAIAKQYFDLTGLDRVTIYNSQGNQIMDATFERVEHLEGMIESEFIAVFKPTVQSWSTGDIGYCLSASLSSYKTSRHVVSEVDNEELTSALYTRFRIDSSNVWKVQHYDLMPGSSTYSVIALSPGSLIIETNDSNESTELYKTEEDYSIMEITPVHIEINGKPVLLALMGVPDTDMIWTSLMVYSSSGYKIAQAGRINGK